MSERFTLVFEGNLREFKGNPHAADTPFGRAVVVSMGDLSQEVERLEADVLRLQQQLDFATDNVREWG